MFRNKALVPDAVCIFKFSFRHIAGYATGCTDVECCHGIRVKLLI